MGTSLYHRRATGQIMETITFGPCPHSVARIRQRCASAALATFSTIYLDVSVPLLICVRVFIHVGANLGARLPKFAPVARVYAREQHDIQVIRTQYQCLAQLS